MDADKKICVLTSSDIPALIMLENACFERPWTSREFEICIQQRYFYAMGIRPWHRLIAYVTFFLIVDELEIVNLAVLGKYRRRGLGQLLMGAVKSFAVSHNMARIVLEVRRSNQSARRLYSKNGFEVLGMRKGYYPPNGEDALIMGYYIPHGNMSGQMRKT